MGKLIKRGFVGADSLNDVVLRHPEITTAPVNAVAATAVLTMDTQPTALTAATAVLTMDTQPLAIAAASVTLTVDTQPLADDTMTIGEKVYTFTADGTATADGEIDVGADLADAKTLIVAAINGTDGINTAHPLVTAAAFATNDCVITAIVAGAAGNAIASTETFDEATNVFDSATLAGGVDADTMTIGEKVYTFTADETAAADGEIDVGADLADAKTLVVAAINGTDGINTAHPDVTAAVFAGDDCTITANVGGAAGNAIATTETFTAVTNVFDTATLEDGVDADTMTIGTKVYTFVADETAAVDGQIDIGADLADAKTLVVAAINGTDGINTAHPDVTAAAFAGDDCTITASVKGTAGNSIATTETFAAATNVFDTATLEDGVDGTDGLAWETLYASGVLYVNATDTGSQGVLTDTWRSSTLTLVS